jgi:hypothetical protein
VTDEENTVLWWGVVLMAVLLLWMLPGCMETGNAQEGARIIRQWVGLP